MRTIHLHGSRCTLTVFDDPDASGASYVYHVNWKDEKTDGYHTLNFQHGSVAEVGVNGLTEGILLTILQDRLRCLQAGPFNYLEDAQALRNVTNALEWWNRKSGARSEKPLQ